MERLEYADMGKLDRLSVEVVETRVEAEDILSYVLIAQDGGQLPAFTAGAHLSVFLPSGLIRQFSLANNPEERGRYVIAVYREPNGRGGSAEMHDRVAVGSKLSITAPINNFPLRAEARRHLLIAGGVGITPIIAMAQMLQRNGASWSLHYCARSVRKMAFRNDLGQSSLAEHTTFYYDDGDPCKGLNTSELLSAESAPATHVYCCGPLGLMQAVKAAGQNWPPGALHFEYFAAENNLKDNSATLERSGSFEIRII
jgi:vanillate O-demethylase ferredoxin subunit